MGLFVLWHSEKASTLWPSGSVQPARKRREQAERQELNLTAMERTVRAAFVNLADRQGHVYKDYHYGLLIEREKREREKQPTCPKVGH